MTTPARIAAFLSTSALCLGLASSPAYADPRDAEGPESRTLSSDRDAAPRGAAPSRDADSKASAGAPASGAAAIHQRTRAR